MQKSFQVPFNDDLVVLSTGQNNGLATVHVSISWRADLIGVMCDLIGVMCQLVLSNIKES